MLKSRVFIYILALLLISLTLSGCYTVIGYPPNANDLTVKKDTGHRGIYREYYNYDSPYYYYDDLDNYSYDLYDWYPFYYFDSNHKYHHDWSYDNLYYGDDNSNYVPEKKPEVRKRDATELRRSPAREEQKKEGTTQSKEKQESTDDDQNSQRRHRDNRK